MGHYRKNRKAESGAALVEWSIGATVFLTAMFGALEVGRLLWIHNALSDAARRGARYAVNQPLSKSDAIKNVAVYGDPSGGTKALVNDLTPENVEVVYDKFDLGEGTVSVSITNYSFRFVLPIIGRTMRMPAYQTTLTGENAGLVPANL